MKRIALVLGFIASLAMSQIANATPVTTTYADDALNWATWTATTNNSSDPFGSPDIESTSVTMDNGLLNNITFNLSSYNFDVKSGDLFLDANSDKTWDYVVRALGTSLNTSANLGLYAVNVGIHDVNAYKMFYYFSDTLVSPPSNFRADVPVGLLLAPTTAILGNVGYSADTSKISFDFTSLSDQISLDSIFTIGYAVTCGNDVVYQPVPEPGTMMLLGLGLLGMAVYGKRRMNKHA